MEYIGLGFCLMLIGVAIGAIAGVVAEEILDERWRRKAQRRRPAAQNAVYREPERERSKLSG